VISAWTQHIKDENEKERFRQHVKSAEPVLERLQEMIDRELKDLENAENSTKIYDLPNWDYRQADGNGFKRFHKMLTKIITLDQKEELN
jgi:hypothetical protein